MPYRLKPRYRDRVNMEVDLVIAREALERIATPYMQMVLNFEVLTITAPAPESSQEEHFPDTERLPRDGVAARLSMETLARILRSRSSSVQQTVREAPKLPWNYPFSAGSRLQAQPEWIGDGRPFSKDIYEQGSNSNWYKQDLKTRTAQIEEWVAAKERREMTLQTTMPDANFRPVEGLCDTYTADSNLDWYEKNLSGNVIADYTAALRSVNAETIKYHQALENWRVLGAQYPPNPHVVE